MANYVVGDVQGCFATLQALLQQANFDARDDCLWFVGDLVNRGPASAEVLRWVFEHQSCSRVVLGNHDLHLIVRYLDRGCRVGSDDTLQDLLGAADVDVLLAWLRAQPLARSFRVGEEDFLLVHAGVDPQWDLQQILTISRRLSTVLSSSSAAELILASFGRGAHRRVAGRAQQRQLPGEQLAYLTRTRTLDTQGFRHDGYVGPANDVPEGVQPWYRLRRAEEVAAFTIVFGHWAAHGAELLPQWGAIATDSGCVWGGDLVLVRLEDRQIVKQSRCDP